MDLSSITLAESTFKEIKLSDKLSKSKDIKDYVLSVAVELSNDLSGAVDGKIVTELSNCKDNTVVLGGSALSSIIGTIDTALEKIING